MIPDVHNGIPACEVEEAKIVFIDGPIFVNIDTTISIAMALVITKVVLKPVVPGRKFPNEICRGICRSPC